MTEPITKPAKRSARYELLDPLRGIAILAVMLLHFSERGRESGDTLVHDHIWPVVQHGYLGVQLFFVISGYCIAAALYGSTNKEQPFRYFMTRRLRRIFPPYWASLLLVVVLGLLTITLLQTPRSTVFPLSTFDWLCNVFLMQGPLHARDANLVYWSLSIELQFYFVMAVALWAPRWTELWLMTVSIIFLAVAHLSGWQLWGTVIAYWPEFLCGIAAYYWLTGRMTWRWTPVILIGLVLLDIALLAQRYEDFVQANGRFVKPIKLAFCLVCMLAMLGLRKYDEAICRRKPVRLLTWFGLISYSLYLTHVPIGTRLFNITGRLMGLEGLKWMLPGTAAMFLCALTGWLFFRWFEKPWLNARVPKTSVPTQPVQEGIVT